MKRVPRLALAAFIILISAVLDQATKKLAVARLAGQPPVEVLGGLLRFDYTENSGALLGLGSRLAFETRIALFSAFVLIVLALAVIFAIWASEYSIAQVIGISLVAGGGVGNLIDRVTNFGWVIDFMQLQAGGLETGIFNTADVLVFAGLVVLLASSLSKRQGSSSPNKADTQDPTQPAR